MLTVSIHQPEFLPWQGFVDKLSRSDVAVILDTVQFRRRYFQNRNRIRSSTGEAWLTVPVLTKGLFSQTIGDVRIRGDLPWRRKHFQTLQRDYAHAPYFEKHFHSLHTIYEAANDSLVDLNLSIIRWIVREFDLRCRLVRSSELGITGHKSDLILALCKATNADVYLSGPSGRDYLDESRFVTLGIQVRYQHFTHPVFRQCYEPFIPMLSVVDLLFNHGPNSVSILRSESGARLEC